MATPVHELDIPTMVFNEGNVAQRFGADVVLPSDTWIVKSLFGYAVWHYDDVTSVLRDKRWHSAAGRIPEIMGITDERFLQRQGISILSAEGDTHLRLRRLVAPAFSPRQADRLRPFMREVINGLVDTVAAAGKADVAVDLCEPYPIPIICELLGAPKSDWQLFSRWANDILEIFSLDVASKLDLIMRTQDELDAYTRDLIEQRRSKPADDLPTDLIAAEEAGDKLSNDELVMMVNAVIVGGTDTTRNQLGCALGLFAEHPDQWALLAERPELAQRAVEETMRYFGAVRGTARFASVDIEYRDVVFPAGTFVSVGLAEPTATLRSSTSRWSSTSRPRRASNPSSPSAPASTTASVRHSHAPSCRRHCRCWPGGCPTCASTAPPSGSPTAWASSAPRTCR